MQLRMEPVVDPETATPIRDNTGLPQLGQVPRNLGLRLIQGIVQLADAQLNLPIEQHQTAQAQGMGERRKKCIN